MHLLRSILPLVLGLVIGLPSPGAAQGRRGEPNTNRPGRDYRNFEVSDRQAGAAICRDACVREGTRCDAWTYVRPGIQGREGHCWLKKPVPAATRDPCCTSGVTVERID